jgi:hypothetical protein
MHILPRLSSWLGLKEITLIGGGDEGENLAVCLGLATIRPVLPLRSLNCEYIIINDSEYCDRSEGYNA